VKLAALALILVTWARAQVAKQANAYYQAPEHRSQLARAMTDPGRDRTQRPRELVASLSIAPGMTVADVGTGPGYMLPFLSATVGPRGRVLAEDIFPDFLEEARQRARSEHLANVSTVLGTQTDPKLPPASLDLALLLDVYHHLNHPRQMLARLRESLKERGRLVIVDYYRRPNAMPWNDALKHIRAGQPQVIREIVASGFRLLSKHDQIPNSQYVLVFRKAAVARGR
jgi:ubiquinone/menaquinone biosynthesis C-methylase UbiE